MIFGNGNHFFGGGSQMIRDEHAWNPWRFPMAAFGGENKIVVARIAVVSRHFFSSPIAMIGTTTGFLLAADFGNPNIPRT